MVRFERARGLCLNRVIVEAVGCYGRTVEVAFQASKGQGERGILFSVSGRSSRA